MSRYAKPREIRFDQKRGDAFATSVGIRFCKDNENSGHAAVGDPRLCALQFVAIADTNRARLNARSVRTSLRFGQAEGAKYFPAGQPRKIFLLLRVGAKRL